MKLGSQEHDNLMAMFERHCRPGRIDKEAKELWPRGIIYQDGHVNKLFNAYRMGYAAGQAVERANHPSGDPQRLGDGK